MWTEIKNLVPNMELPVTNGRNQKFHDGKGREMEKWATGFQGKVTLWKQGIGPQIFKSTFEIVWPRHG